MEAVKTYLKKYGQPKRKIYLAFGHDEEMEGNKGAKKIAEHLQSLNVKLEYVIDEGTMILSNLFSYWNKSIALISIAEKGYLTVKFYVNTTGGHSSMPDEANSALVILSKAINRLNQNKVPSYLGYGPEKFTFEKMGSHLPFTRRMALSNLWLFKPIVEKYV